MTKEKKKHIPKIILCILMCLIILVGIALGFMTATDSAVNTMSYGNVKAILYEDDWYSHDSQTLLNDTDSDHIKDEAENLVPGEVLSKTPYLVSTGINDCYAYISVAVPTLDMSVVYGDEEEMQKLANKVLDVKVKGYVIQDKVLDKEGITGETEKEKTDNYLSAVWDIYKNGDSNLFPTERTDYSKVEAVQIQGLDLDNWVLVDTMKCSEELLVNDIGNAILDSDGNNQYICYNYYVYAFDGGSNNGLLYGTKSLAASVITGETTTEVTEETTSSEESTTAEETTSAPEETTAAEETTETTNVEAETSYYESIDERVKTTPLFTSFKLTNLGAKAWSAVSGQSFESINGASWSSTNWGYSFNDDVVDTWYTIGDEVQLNDFATLVIDWEEKDSKKYLVATITLADGSQFYTDIGLDYFLGSRTVKTSNGSTIADGLYAAASANPDGYKFKISDVYFGKNKRNSYYDSLYGTYFNSYYAPEISIVCYTPGTYYQQGMCLWFNTLKYKGESYNLSGSSTTKVVASGSEASPIYSGDYKTWFETCINTGGVIGTFAWIS